MKNVYLIILDSLGIGNAPDAQKFGDKGSNTYKAISKFCDIPNLKRLGLNNIDSITFADGVENPIASYGEMIELSQGKDTTTGHYEIAGLIVERPYPTYPDGFPKEVVRQLCKEWGVEGVLGNKSASGTEIIKEFGKEHEKTGLPIVYTSADSVLQIACSVDTFGLQRLYEFCEKARGIMTGDNNVGRIIARPFSKDKDGNYYRTPDRRDYALDPPGKTLLDKLQEKGVQVVSVGKIRDIFNNNGIDVALDAHGNYEVYNQIMQFIPQKNSLVFANFVDFDMLYGHRNDVEGYAKCLSEFDTYLGQILNKIGNDDLLIITADHGCDPSTQSTDHSRENVPLLIYSSKIKAKNLGRITGFNYVAKEIEKFFDIKD